MLQIYNKNINLLKLYAPYFRLSAILLQTIKSDILGWVLFYYSLSTKYFRLREITADTNNKRLSIVTIHYFYFMKWGLNKELFTYLLYLSENVAQGQFLCWVVLVWIQNFYSPRCVVALRLKSPVCSTKQRSMCPGVKLQCFPLSVLLWNQEQRILRMPSGLDVIDLILLFYIILDYYLHYWFCYYFFVDIFLGLFYGGARGEWLSS